LSGDHQFPTQSDRLTAEAAENAEELLDSR
jgi:hypothetical protein